MLLSSKDLEGCLATFITFDEFSGKIEHLNFEVPEDIEDIHESPENFYFIYVNIYR